MNLRKLDFVVLIGFPVGPLREPARAKCGDSSNGVRKGTTGKFGGRHIERAMQIR
jgi:hypothetical protein